MFLSEKLLVALNFIVSIAAFSLEERGASVLVGYRTLRPVRRDFQYRGCISMIFPSVATPSHEKKTLQQMLFY
jgi:hypothetical protein